MKVILLWVLWKALGKGTQQDFYQIFTLMKLRIGNGTLSIVYEIDKDVVSMRSNKGTT